MNLILERTDQMEYFTYLPLVFEALKIQCEDYDWYISDVETNGFEFKDSWYSGQELKDQIENNQIQFIWGVLSCFKKEERPKVMNSPFVDGNPYYWNGSEPQTQLKGAEFEIACWDSSGVILIGLDETFANNFKSKYSDAKPLRNDRT